MKAKVSQPATPDWTHPVAVTDIPPNGLQCRIAPDRSAELALAARAGVVALDSTQAELALTNLAGGRVGVSGRVRAQVTQNCVVTLEPVTSALDEEIDVVFVPPVEGQPARPAGEEDGEADPPEELVDGRIDLGTVAAECLILGIDPYPRKPGAVFDRPAEAKAPEDHPFAALAALRKPPGDAQ